MNCVRQVLIALSFATSAAAHTVATATPRSPDDAVVTYGGFADSGYLFDFNEPTNKLFRSRGTPWHTDDLHLKMSGVYIKKRLAD
jgi:hypothetical protein